MKLNIHVGVVGDDALLNANTCQWRVWLERKKNLSSNSCAKTGWISETNVIKAKHLRVPAVEIHGLHLLIETACKMLFGLEFVDHFARCSMSKITRVSYSR